MAAGIATAVGAPALTKSDPAAISCWRVIVGKRSSAALYKERHTHHRTADRETPFP